MCILVVEDDPLIREILIEELSDHGYEAQGASTGDEAAAMLDRLEPPLCVLVTDIHMPGDTDGIALADLVGQRSPQTPVIFTTGRPDALLRVAVLGEGRFLIRKPYIPAEVLSRIDALTCRP